MNKKRLFGSILLSSLLAVPSALAQNVFEPVSDVMLQLSGLITSPTNGPWISAIIILLFFVSIVYIGLGKRLEGKAGGKIVIWALGLLLAFGLIRLEPDLLEIAGPVAGALLIVFGAFLIYKMFVGIGFPGADDKMGAASIAFFVVWLAGNFFFSDLLSEPPFDFVWGLISIIAVISFFVIVFRIISFGRSAFTPSQKTMQDIHERLTSSPQVSDVARAAAAKAGKDLRNLGGAFKDFAKGVGGIDISSEEAAFNQQVKDSKSQTKDLKDIIPLIDSTMLRTDINQEHKDKIESEIKGKISDIINKENKIEDYNKILLNITQRLKDLNPERVLATMETYVADARQAFAEIPGAVERINRIEQHFRDELNILINDTREDSEFIQLITNVVASTELFRKKLKELTEAFKTLPINWRLIRTICEDSIPMKESIEATLLEANKYRQRIDNVRSDLVRSISQKYGIPNELVYLYGQLKGQIERK